MNIVFIGTIDKNTNKFIDELLKSDKYNYNIIVSNHLDQKEDKHKHKLVTYIKNKDPGLLNDINNRNLNRYIVNCYNALKELDSDSLTLIIRSDCILTNDNFIDSLLSRMNECQWRGQDYCLFDDKIIIPNIDTFNPITKQRLLFHPSLWFGFGYTKDLMKLYDIPLHKNENIFTDKGFLKYKNEQYIFIKCLQKEYSNIDIQDSQYWHPSLAKISIQTIMNNFAIIDIHKMGVINSKNITPISDHYLCEDYYDNLLSNYKKFEELQCK